MGEGPSGKTFLIVVLSIAIVILVGVIFTAKKLGEPMDLITAVGATVSALVVAAFLAIYVMAPRNREPEIEGFDVDQIKRP